MGEKAPSYGTVFSIVRDLGADLVTLAHEGTKAYSNTFELVHRREAAGPNAAEPMRGGTGPEHARRDADGRPPVPLAPALAPAPARI